MEHLKAVAQASISGMSGGNIAAGIHSGIKMETRYDLVARNSKGEILWEETAYNRVVTAGLNKLLDATFKTGLATPAWYMGLAKPTLTNAAMTSGSAVLGSTTAPWISADEGRAIIVRGAGIAGADLVTTISTVTTSSSIGLSTTAALSVTNAAVIWDARAADTAASHTPWLESTNYSNANRLTYTPAVPAAGSINNSTTVAVFNINLDNTLIGGMFISDSSVIGGVAGTLYGMAPFSAVGFRQVNNGDTLSVTATLTAASA